MCRFSVGLLCALLFSLLLLPRQASAQQFDVVEVEPEQNSIIAQATDTIAVTFQGSIAADPPEIDVLGSQFGRHSGEVEVESNTLRFISNCPFRPGETVTVTISDADESYVWQFTVRSEFGSGGFSPEDPVTLGGASSASEPPKVGSVTIPSEPYAGYVDGDLLTDVAIVNQETEQIEVRFGPDLDGSDAQTIPVPDAKTLAGGDINGDGRPDFVTANSFTDALTIVVNQETGFSVEGTISTGSRPTDVAIADLNGDGAQDIAVAPFGDNRVFVHFNDGTGSFPSQQEYDAGAGPISIAAQDIDNDGDLDLLVGSTGEESIELLENDGDRAFTRSNNPIGLDFTPATLTSNDVIGDDNLVDLVVSAQSGSQISLYENTGGAFAFSESISSPDAPARGATFADVDASEENTYDLDFISAHRSVNSLQLALNQSNGGYDVDETFPSDEQPVEVVNLDVDRDEAQDFVAFDARGTTSQLFRNQGRRQSPVTLDKSLLSYGGVCVGDDSTKALQVENITNNDVVISKSAVPEGFTANGSLPDTLRPSETQAIQITFAPGKIREYSGEFVLEADERTEECGQPTPPVDVPVDVTGRGEGTELSTNIDTLDLGEVIVGNSATESFEILNEGNIDADIQSIEGLAGTPFEVPSPPSEIPPGGQQVTVEFSPDSPNNDYTETLRLITSSKCGQDTVEVILTGSSRLQLPDLVAEEIRTVDSPDEINVSDTVDVVCEFSNQGGRDIEESFSAKISQDGSELDSFPFEGLGVGETRQTPPTPVSFSAEGPTEITCEVDAGSVVSERDETNNTASLTLNIQRPDQLPVSPNPFTPNDDGFNDSVEFQISEFGLDQATVEIYNFDGRLINTLDEIENGAVEWEGMDDSGEDMPPGVYAYVVRDGGQAVVSGHITLAR